MKNRISNIKNKLKKKEGIFIICIIALSVIAVMGLLIIDNQPDDSSALPHVDGNEISQEAQPLQTAVINLQDFQEALTDEDDFIHGWAMDNEITRVDLPDGYHAQFLSCGCTYEGYWVNGLPNGQGKYTQPMMEGLSEGLAILEGYFIDGIAHGMVTYTRIWPDRTWVFEFEADMGYQIEDSVMSEDGILLPPARFPLVIHLVMDHYLATNENWQN